MKKIVSLLAIVLAFGITCANAQPMESSEVAEAQDSSMDNPGMMQGDHRRMDVMGGHMGMPGDTMEARHHIMRMMKEIGLDEKQMETVHDIVDRTAKTKIRKKADLLTAKIDLEDLIHREPMDMAAIEAKLKQIEAMKTDMFMTHLKAMEEIKAVLTPQQRDKLKEMMEAHMGAKDMKKGKKQYQEDKRMMK